MSRSRPQRRVTRRQVLGGVAAAGAASLVQPGTGLSAALDGRRTVSSRWIGSLPRGSHELAAPRSFALVGVEWTAPATAQLELRTRARGGAWSPWVQASVRGHEPDGWGDSAARFGEPIWTGPADRIQLRSSGSVRGVRVHFVSASPGQAASATAAFRLAAPVLDAGPGQPPIIARGGWAQGQAPPRVAPHYGTVKLAFVHHSQSSNGYGAAEVPAILRSIYDYHVYVRGFWDIAYNFAIDAFGRIWEARAGGIDRPVVGAQAGGYNRVSTGAVVLGSFISVAPPPAAIAALEWLLAWKLSLHGIPTHGRVTVEVNPSDAFYTPFAPGAQVSLPRVAGHRDGDSTDCPGDAFYARLPTIRPRISALAGVPARVTLKGPGGPSLANSPLPVSGRLALLPGPPLAGAPIEVQRLTRGATTTVATATSGADGSWSAQLALTHTTNLRALHRPRPAVASDPVQFEVATQVTLNVDSFSPLRVSGAVVPFKRSVTIDVYAAPLGNGRPVARKRALVRQGRYATNVVVPRPGRYVLIARTSPDARNVAGASAPFTVQV